MLGGSSYHHHNPKPTLILQVTRETLSSWAGAIVLEPIFFGLQTNYLNRLFVTREEVPRLTVTWTR